jgi:hypothetical protein
VRKVRLLIVITILVIFFVGIIALILKYVQPTAAGILVESNPISDVYINNEFVGRTPYKKNRPPEEIVLKMIPEGVDSSITYETKIVLVSGVETVIRRDFGPGSISAGEIVSFEKSHKGNAGLAVVSIPDAVQVSINSEHKGFAPYKSSNTPQGEHTLTLTMEGYESRTIKIRTHKNYNLTAIVSLAPVLQPETQTPVVEEKEEEFVEILPTGVGFLRVRSTPATTAREVGRVEPGETYLLLEENEATGWFKIEFEDQEGWVSNQFARKIETGVPPSPSPTLSPAPTPTSNNQEL